MRLKESKFEGWVGVLDRFLCFSSRFRVNNELSGSKIKFLYILWFCVWNLVCANEKLFLKIKVLLNFVFLLYFYFNSIREFPKKKKNFPHVLSLFFTSFYFLSVNVSCFFLPCSSVFLIFVPTPFLIVVQLGVRLLFRISVQFGIE